MNETFPNKLMKLDFTLDGDITNLSWLTEYLDDKTDDENCQAAAQKFMESMSGSSTIPCLTERPDGAPRAVLVQPKNIKVVRIDAVSVVVPNKVPENGATT